jgi:hypothetical protein
MPERSAREEARAACAAGQKRQHAQTAMRAAIEMLKSRASPAELQKSKTSPLPNQDGIVIHYQLRWNANLRTGGNAAGT